MPTPSYISDRLEVSRITQSPMIVYDTVGSPVGFNTTTITLDNGYSYSFERYDQSRAKFNVGDRNYSKEEWEYLLNFFYDKRGSAIAFRYKDWGDYQAVNQTLGIGDGINTIFYFTKFYGDYQKAITQLVNGTVKLRVNGVLTALGFTIYYDFGIVVFNSAVADDAIVTADFEFDLRVRFDNDSLSSRFEAKKGDRYIVNVGSILIVETLILLWGCSYGVCSLSPNGIYGTQAECEVALTTATTPLITDGSFTANWTSYSLRNNVGSGTQTTTTEVSGGNPDNYRRTSISITSPDTTQSIVEVYYFNSLAAYSLPNAVVSVKVNLDAKTSFTPNRDLDVYSAIRQNGFIYIGAVVNVGANLNWTPKVLNAAASSFTRRSNNTSSGFIIITTDPPIVDGSQPFEVGYAVQSSSGNASQTSIYGTDNVSLSVTYRDCP